MNNSIVIVTIFCLAFVATSVVYGAQSSVSNSISIKSTSEQEQENTIHIRTTVNGELVEDYHATSSSPLNYSKSWSTAVSADSDSSPVHHVADIDEDAYRAKLLAIITRLQALIKLYVIQLSQS